MTSLKRHHLHNRLIGLQYTAQCTALLPQLVDNDLHLNPQDGCTLYAHLPLLHCLALKLQCDNPSLDVTYCSSGHKQLLRISCTTHTHAHNVQLTHRDNALTCIYCPRSVYFFQLTRCCELGSKGDKDASLSSNMLVQQARKHAENMTQCKQ